jgi:hypothetical protein
LAFRELGLAIGLAAVERMGERATALRAHTALKSELVEAWLRDDHRRTSVWAEHRDINEVMLATCLVPEWFLVMGDSARAL